jgi:transcriptional regulator NrdR family protein
MSRSNPGVSCPRCGCGHVPVYYTRRVGKFTRRRRECRHCGHMFTTTEMVGALSDPPVPPVEQSSLKLPNL